MKKNSAIEHYRGEEETDKFDTELEIRFFDRCITHVYLNKTTKYRPIISCRPRQKQYTVL